MKIIKIALVILGVLALIVLGVLWSSGFFADIKMEEKEMGGYLVIGKDITGPYEQTGKYMQQVESKIKAEGIPVSKGLGIYYDNPDVTPKEKCRSFVGSIIDKNDMAKALSIQASDLRIDSIPTAQSVVVEFPANNQISYMVGPIKVYPALNEYMKEKNYKCTLSFEVYDMNQRKIIYVMQYASDN